MANQAVAQSKSSDESRRQAEELLLQGRMGKIGHKLLVLSGKGGVGKSTIAANLAVSLATAGKNVGLLDVDVHGPSVPKLLGLEGCQIECGDNELLPVRVIDNLAVMSIGFMLPGGGEPVIWRGPRKHGAIRQFLKDVAWGNLDYLVIDSPPGTGDEPMSVAQLVGEPAGAVIVTTPQDVAIADVRRCISFCRALSLPIVGIVENMSSYLCPNCGARFDLFKTGGGKTLAKEMKVPFLGSVPFDPLIVNAGDAGQPFVSKRGETPAGLALAGVVRSILAQQEQDETAVTTDNKSEENHHVKIAIPVVDGCLSAHFGHCEEFAILEVDREEGKVVSKSVHRAPPHEPGSLPRWLRDLGADVIIAGGIGQRAQQLLAQDGITVLVGAPAETPEQLASAYLSGTLHTGENICDH